MILWDETQTITDVVQALSDANKIMDLPPVNFDPYQLHDDLQYLIGVKWRINIFKNGNVSMLLGGKDIYDTITTYKKRLEEHNINFKLRIDSQAKLPNGNLPFKIIIDLNHENRNVTIIKALEILNGSDAK